MTRITARQVATAQRPGIRRGVTMLELIVVVVVLGAISSVTMLVMPKKIVPPDDTAHRIANARTLALRTGRSVSVVVVLDTTFSLATAMPDGTVLTDSSARIDRLTGQPMAPIDTSVIGRAK